MYFVRKIDQRELIFMAPEIIEYYNSESKQYSSEYPYKADYYSAAVVILFMMTLGRCEDEILKFYK